MKLSHRRKFLCLTAGAAALPAVSRIGLAQTYPTRPVRIVVGFAAGGAADIIARLIGQWLSERLGQQFIIENRPGAGTNIATEAVVRAPADGYTLLAVTSSNSSNATLYEALPFNLMRDIVPVAGLVRNALVIEVNPSVPVRTISEFVAYAKANPGKVNVASYGVGTTGHLAQELFKMLTGVTMVHVPYRGDGPALTDTISGQVQATFSTIPASIEFVRTGKLRALAVTTATRSELLPGIPSVGEFVPGYEVSTWVGIGVPKGTPSEIIGKLNREINEGLADPKLKARIADLGSVPLPITASAFGTLIGDDTEKWAKVIRAANIKAE
jgi:tripartite-type tricarboxylate transporter receptor subunit TctC